MIDRSFLNQISDPLASARIVPTLEQCTLETIRVDALALRNQTVSPAEFIHAKMLENAVGSEVRELRSLLRPDDSRKWFDPSFSADFVKALLTFKALVGEGAPWDYKHVINALPKKSHLFGGRRLKTDVWGNVHYGYIGRASGFSKYTLLLGAAIHQFLTSDYNPMEEAVLAARMPPVLFFIDDPRDTKAILLGMNLYDTYGATISIEAFEREVQAAPSGL